MNIYEFMGEHPFLTFFLAGFFARAVGYIAFGIGGCKNCKHFKDIK